MAIILSAEEAVKRIPDGATVFVLPMPLEEVFPAFYRVYEETGSPRDLTVVWAAGIGPFNADPRGMNHFAHPGMVKRVILGHVGLNHAMVKVIGANEVEAYNFPQGVISQWFREVAAGRPGLITRVGLGTFVDPRIEGGKLNDRTRQCEDLVEVVTIGDKELLRYKPIRGDVGVIRGTTADPYGNITSENEAILMEPLEIAMAAKNSGGLVIAQVERLSDTPALPSAVTIPGVMVDIIVVASSQEKHPHTLFADHDPSYTGAARADLSKDLAPMPLCAEKVICRRAFQEISRGDLVNLGVGIPMGVAKVAQEEGLLDNITLTTELGVIGGLPQGGKNFGPAQNPHAIISQAAMFDYYDGGGINISCVGIAQVDGEGNVNVSKLGSHVIGSGGFINITQSSPKVMFCGEFTAAGTDVVVEDGKIVIRSEGKAVKFVKEVGQITFSGKVAREEGHKVLYITERCVFQLTPEGVVLTEIAPGVDLEQDILARMEFRPLISPELKEMDPRLFADAPMSSSA
ncbi:MAG TPA: CoA-transferase [Candidatus Hydrogenedentes bacterium]|jgi:propionate CoA-transferase|nr:MAG: Acetate CoA-transferase YdiF [Candidatus Hydrogenedentes bacterium ADurb.Bin170]HPX86684.1 CoA-transferase [Candidatus Hydrogenedentota bacterium]HQB02313.1 CoA-transferase [Candidatus Hydrogenedentota bacterium]